MNLHDLCMAVSRSNALATLFILPISDLPGDSCALESFPILPSDSLLASLIACKWTPCPALSSATANWSSRITHEGYGMHLFVSVSFDDEHQHTGETDWQSNPNASPLSLVVT